MKRYELELKILDENYADSLIISLVRQGYNVYLSENSIYFEIGDDELTEIKNV